MTTRRLTLEEIATRTQMLVHKHEWDAAGSDKPQTARNIATSIVVEAAELLECFQWREVADPNKVADELADIILFTAYLAKLMGLDLTGAVERKMALNEQRSWPSDIKGRK